MVLKVLLSIHKLCGDNKVLVEFDSHKVQIKELNTDEVICKGREHGGMYKLLVGHSPTVCLSEIVSSQVWHNHLARSS